MKKSIAVAKGDGIGTEIMSVVINIFKTLDIPLDYHFIDMGRDFFLKGYKTGMTPEAKSTVESLGVLFKGPMETPKGSGNTSINVTARKMWSTFANCRRFKSLPGVETIFSKAGVPIDLTIIRENLEDTYSGVEHMLTPDLAVSRKFTSALGSYKIHRYAFEFAKNNHIGEVTCAHKANIMKLTDGMFLEIFYEVAKSYPNIKASDVIVDDMCMKLVTIPDQYKLIVLPNLQGDIVSDLCAGLVGGLGFAPSANIGQKISIFEAVHGTAPTIAGKNLANPTALLMSGIMMLKYLDLNKEGDKLELALLNTLKNGIHTSDLKDGNTPVSCTEYGKAIIQEALAIKSLDIPSNHDVLTSSKSSLKSSEEMSEDYSCNTKIKAFKTAETKCVGVDIFIESFESSNDLVSGVNTLLQNNKLNFVLEAITNRGTNVYPNGSKFVEYINSYTIRMVTDQKVNEQNILKLVLEFSEKYQISSIEILKTYNDKLGFSKV